MTPMSFSQPSSVDLDQLAMGPFDSLFRCGPLHRLRVHVGNDVLRDYLGGFAVGRSGIAGEMAALGGGAERQHNGIFLPKLVVFPDFGWADRETLLCHPPLLVNFLGVEPA